MWEERITVSRREDGALSGNALPARFCVGRDANKTNDIIRLGYFKLSNNSSSFSLLKKHSDGVSQRFCCILVKTSRIFDKEPFLLT